MHKPGCPSALHYVFPDRDLALSVFETHQLLQLFFQFTPNLVDRKGLDLRDKALTLAREVFCESALADNVVQRLWHTSKTLKSNAEKNAVLFFTVIGVVGRAVVASFPGCSVFSPRLLCVVGVFFSCSVWNSFQRDSAGVCRCFQEVGSVLRREV